MILLSKNQIKLITSLQQKKYRNKLGLFVAEGPKVINELLTAKLELHSLYSSEENTFEREDVQLISKTDLKKISFLKNANNSVAVFKIPEQSSKNNNTLILMLDAIRDPGNLGTIIRLCDWFGIEQIICSVDTVDCYNPKVIQATMGSLSRVSVSYLNINECLQNTKLPVYGTCMDGTSIYSENLPEKGIIIMGNEANGISENIMELISHKITIPRFGKLKETESLNVATATAIVLNEFKRSTEK